MDLSTIFQTVSDTEMKLIPIFVTNPENQAIAGIAFLAEQALFNLIVSLHSQKASTPAPAPAPVVAAPAPAPVPAPVPAPAPSPAESIPASATNLNALGLPINLTGAISGLRAA